MASVRAMCVFIVPLPADTDHRGRALWKGSGDVAHFPKSYVQSHHLLREALSHRSWRRRRSRRCRTARCDATAALWKVGAARDVRTGSVACNVTERRRHRATNALNRRRLKEGEMLQLAKRAQRSGEAFIAVKPDVAQLR